MVEIHFHGPLFSRTERQTPSPSVDREGAAASEPETEAGGGGGGGTALAGLIALAALVGVAYAVRRLGGEDGAEIELDE